MLWIWLGCPGAMKESLEEGVILKDIDAIVPQNSWL